MEKPIKPFLFTAAALIFLLTLLGASVMLPHDRYHRFQAHDNVTTRKADWIYERLHFDDTPIDVALIGTSRTAGGLSAPLIEEEYCRATGRRIHVVNLAIPVTGRNMHYLIAREAAVTKSPALFIVELNEIESRRPHSGFIFLADAKDILTAPILINLNYISDLIRLPGRQIELFVRGVIGEAPVRYQFDPTAYYGEHLDLTKTIVSIDGRARSRDIIHSGDEMERLRQQRTKGVSPTYILPKPLRAIEYRFPKIYLKKLEEIAVENHGRVAYAYLPAYGAAHMPDEVLNELEINASVIDLGGASALAPENWLDATHFNQRGAEDASRRFAKQLAARDRALGVAGQCNSVNP